uniref:2Fe-2S ferredoxin-type domain-containing protein n=1 Tax=Strigamia maritima TaxID=126957 RepID=T1IKM9_STRMM
MAAMLSSVLRFCVCERRYRISSRLSPLFTFLNQSLQHNSHMPRVFTSSEPKLKEKNTVTVTFLDPEGNHFCTTSGPEGSTLLELAKEGTAYFDGYGECDGGMSCTTCHVILNSKDYDLVPDKLHPEEDDLLSRSAAVTETYNHSRLGCQVRITKELDGITVQIGPDTSL